MKDIIKDCPCTGKSSTTYAAPWILLLLFEHTELHGYALAEMIGEYLEPFGAGLNITGIYRHLNALEKRGILTSEVDISGKKPSRKKYRLTESGEACLQNWIYTMQMQTGLIESFIAKAKKELPPSFFLSRQ